MSGIPVLLDVKSCYSATDLGCWMVEFDREIS